MLKYKILNKNTDSFIDIPLNMKFDPMDNSEIVEEIIRQEKRKSINVQEDMEIFRYSPFDNQSFVPVLNIWFYDCDINNYVKNYSANGFNITNNSTDERLKKGFSKSFYVMDFYDSIDIRTQNKISTIIIPTVPLKNVNKLLLIPNLEMNLNSEGYYIYYLKNIDFPKDIFMKLTFFNAKTGKRISFFNMKKIFMSSQLSSQLQSQLLASAMATPDVPSFSTNFVKPILPISEQYKDEMLYFKYKLENNYKYDITDGVRFPITKQILAIEIKFN